MILDDRDMLEPIEKLINDESDLSIVKEFKKVKMEMQLDQMEYQQNFSIIWVKLSSIIR